jgi:hypothetical protein
MSLPLYIDHNVDRAIVAGLRARGIDVLTAMEDGFDTHDDEAVFERATALGRVAVTNDKDFLAIAHRWQDDGHYFTGLIRARQDRVSLGAVIEDIELIAKLKEPREMENHIDYVPFSVG